MHLGGTLGLCFMMVRRLYAEPELVVQSHFSTAQQSIFNWKPDPLYNFWDSGISLDVPGITFEKNLSQGRPMLIPNSIFLVWDILGISRSGHVEILYHDHRFLILRH